MASPRKRKLRKLAALKRVASPPQEPVEKAETKPAKEKKGVVKKVLDKLKED